MADQLFDSSDSVRSGRELTHAEYVTFDEPLELEREGTLSGVTVAYETYGRLNAARDNAILICHALSGDSHVASHDEADDPGWWDILVGPGKMIDTDRYFVVCPNVLGGCRGTTGPSSINPATGRRYGTDFPTITIGDVVETQRRLIDHLGIGKLLAVVGGSLGGVMTLQWATAHSDRLRSAVPIATSAHLTSQALAFDIVARNAILRDPDFHSGQYEENDTRPAAGLAIARMLGHITYLSRESMKRKFDACRMDPRDVATDFETMFAVGSYLAYQGDKFVERFDANSYVTLSMAMDLFDLGSTPEELAKSFEASTCRWLMISYSTDWLFPPFQSREMVDTLISQGKPITYCEVESDCGHDAFLLKDELNVYGRLIESFLDTVHRSAETDVDRPATPREVEQQKRSKRQRIDYDRIAELIPEGSSVLDLGCGGGGLLNKLRKRGGGPLLGLEIDEELILRCAERGIDVVYADINEGLSAFNDKQFHFVLLSKTLQTVRDVEFILDEMLRVGEQCIVSFPNMGYHKFREQLAAGHAPTIDSDAGLHWFNTANVRFLTIADFEDFCKAKGITIHKTVALDTENETVVEDDPNLNADVAIVVLTK